MKIQRLVKASKIILYFEEYFHVKHVSSNRARVYFRLRILVCSGLLFTAKKIHF